MRNSAIDIAKGIGIILMVIGHSGCPELLYKLIYSFHMPLFFILSGYFLSEKSIIDTHSFLVKKWKKLAMPLLICGIVSLLLHNVFLHLGITNEFYGTRTGEVSHMFGVKDTAFRLGLLIGFLEVYDDPFLGACWFIQCMFFAYVGIAIIHKLFRNLPWDKQRIIGISTFIGFSLILTTIHWLFPAIKTVFLTRVVIAGVFIYMGSFAHTAIETWKIQWWHLCIFALPCCYAIYSPYSISMGEYITPMQFLILLITGMSGTFFIYGLGRQTNKLVSHILELCGQHSIYILYLHFIMFKPISFVFIKIYHLDSKMIGCWPTIWQITNIWHWIIYAIGSLTLCMTIALICQKVKSYIISDISRSRKDFIS